MPISAPKKKPAMTQAIGEGFHADHTYDVAPALGSMLVARHLPETGGSTIFVDMVKAYSKACGHELAYQMADRRPGDVAVVYGATDKAKAELGWTAELGLDDMCADSWRWISNNPQGFDTAK